MDHNYPMKKLGYNNKDYKRTKSNSCSFYFRYCLLCTSIIQLLIILGLVLFMIYGSTHSNQQSQLKSTQNQSAKLIEDIENLQSTINKQKKNMTGCYYLAGNLTEKLNNMNKSLQTCIPRKNLTSLKYCLPYYSYFQDCILKADYDTLKRNYSTLQDQLAKLMVEQELKEARQKLEEARLHNKISNLLLQLQDLKGNCTSMSKDFQTALDKAKANYESNFKKLTTGVSYSLDLNDQLKRVKANCTPLSLRFQMDIRQKVSEFEKNFSRAWQLNSEQKSKIDDLEKMNNKCKQDAQTKSDEFTQREWKLREEIQKYMEERIQLLEERNKLRSQLAALKDRKPQLPLLSQRGIQPLISSCQAQAEVINQMKQSLDLKDWNLKSMHLEVETLKQRLKEQETRCLEWKLLN
ncbi:plasmalemma vesicle associated protein a [Pristis pectinata]|uniref:plasmalemma vesicle associated protein a n=1 Tax=Pristis pectinata TaxID=685728 RepID=UPI00223CC56B|nr:plasmalemma vesicle associated protein a [Pristis pectinata]XP_051894225.1 plasmalemma vesicle associated protein a [Pristis pectinata]